MTQSYTYELNQQVEFRTGKLLSNAVALPCEEANIFENSVLFLFK